MQGLGKKKNSRQETEVKRIEFIRAGDAVRTAEGLSESQPRTWDIFLFLQPGNNGTGQKFCKSFADWMRYVYFLYTWEENSVNTFLHMRQKGTNKAVWEGSEILQQLQHGGRVWCFLFLCSDALQAELILFFCALGTASP